MKLAYAILYTNDLDRSIDFYIKQIGLTLISKNNNFASFQLENKITLGIKKAIEKREIPGVQTVIFHSSNIKATYNKFKYLNLYSKLETTDWGTNFSILDPDGNRIEFVELL